MFILRSSCFLIGLATKYKYLILKILTKLCTFSVHFEFICASGVAKSTSCICVMDVIASQLHSG